MSRYTQLKTAPEQRPGPITKPLPNHLHAHAQYSLKTRSPYSISINSKTPLSALQFLYRDVPASFVGLLARRRNGRSHGPLGKDSTTEFSYRNSFVATRSLLDPEPRAWRFEDVRVWGMEKERAARCATVDACVGDVGMSVNDDRNLLRSRRRSVSLVRTIGISRASSISCAVVRGG